MEVVRVSSGFLAQTLDVVDAAIHPPDVLAAEVRAGIEQWIDLERHAEQVEAERADRAELILGLPAGSPPEAP